MFLHLLKKLFPVFISNKKQASRGFTLVEMLIVIGIIATLSGVVMFQYSRFDSQVLLRNLAYEVALSIREAQIYGVSVRGSGSSFNTQFGVHFTLSEDTKVRLFRDTNSDGKYTEAEDILLQTITIGRRNYIKRLCVDDVCTSPSLSVYFKRPFSDANFWADGTVQASASKVKIVIGSKINDASVRTVVVTKTGQIYVE